MHTRKFRSPASRIAMTAIMALAIGACQSTSELTPHALIKMPKKKAAKDSIATARKEPGELFFVAEGTASYYADRFHGRMTANGETFDMEKLTAAHRTLPFNTWVRVTNLQNGQQVIVRINDRGPFVEGRIIDLSKGAAEELDLVRPGTGEVRIEAYEHGAPPEAQG